MQTLRESCIGSEGREKLLIHGCEAFSGSLEVFGCLELLGSLSGAVQGRS